jgi:hypothetical protein
VRGRERERVREKDRVERKWEMDIWDEEEWRRGGRGKNVIYHHTVV